MSAGERFHGLEIALRSLEGARAVRVVHPPGQTIAAHRHDWPFVSIHVLGGYAERFDGGETRIDRPSVAIHPAGAEHEDAIEELGLETVSLEFDPAWLRLAGVERLPDRSVCLVGGAAATTARRVAAVWSTEDASEDALRRAAVALFRAAAGPRLSEPAWLAGVRARAEAGSVSDAGDAALHPAWLARAYRSAIGEGLRETVRRKRAERAVVLLREGDLPLAEIALACGFCDQSHMNRTFADLLGRTPAAVRRERAALRPFTGRETSARA